MLSHKYHYFLILAVQLLTYIVFYFPVHQLLISHDFPLSHDHVTVAKSRDHVNLQTYDICFILSYLTINMTQNGGLCWIFTVWDGFGTGNERKRMFVVGWVTNTWGGYM